MKRKKYILILLIITLISGVAVYKYTYKDHLNIASAKIDFKIKSTDLLKAFGEDGDLNTKKYLNKIIVVTGTVSEKDTVSLTLDDGVLCYFLKTDSKKSKGDIKIKGRCIGYDELLEVVKLDQCSYIE